jgi:hypothetical protein
MLKSVSSKGKRVECWVGENVSVPKEVVFSIFIDREFMLSCTRSRLAYHILYGMLLFLSLS